MIRAFFPSSEKWLPTSEFIVESPWGPAGFVLEAKIDKKICPLSDQAVFTRSCASYRARRHSMTPTVIVRLYSHESFESLASGTFKLAFLSTHLVSRFAVALNRLGKVEVVFASSHGAATWRRLFDSRHAL